MQITYCDKCGKELKEDLYTGNNCFVVFHGGHNFLELKNNIHLCEKCTPKLSQAMNKFMGIKKFNGVNIDRDKKKTK